MTPPDAAAIAGLFALADRCEAATGADRELDRDIALLRGEYDQPEDLGSFLDPAEAVVGGGGQTYAPPAYTASLDVALTLVPDDVFEWHAGRHFKTRGGQAYIVLGGGVRCDPIYRLAATPALALCAAALRARAHLKDTPDAP